MSGIGDLNNIWQNVREVDLRPIRARAERPLKLALAGYDLAACRTLAAGLRIDPARPTEQALTPLAIHDLSAGLSAIAQAALPGNGVDLVVLVSSSAEMAAADRQAAQALLTAGESVLVVAVPDRDENSGPNPTWQGWPVGRLCTGRPDDIDFLEDKLAPAVLRWMRGEELALARNFPLFRSLVAAELIQDASVSNAAYALSTGLAEIVPVFDIPLNVADIIVLTKAQAFLVYRLGLALGLSTRWQDYVTEFGGVLGGGFFWRQVARQLIGLIPVWGILPKVAVAYAGTYVIGQTVLRWYLTGRHVDRQQLSILYRQAFAQGKQVAGRLAERMPRFRLRRRKAPDALPAQVETSRVCLHCARSSAADATFCQYCGLPFPPDDLPGPDAAHV